jgi:hypothetical protein
MQNLNDLELKWHSDADKTIKTRCKLGNSKRTMQRKAKDDRERLEISKSMKPITSFFKPTYKIVNSFNTTHTTKSED